MELTKLLEEYKDCHDKERMKYLKDEIDKRVKEYISQCIDYQMDFIHS